MIKKNISKILLAIILLFSLSACGELMSLLSDPYANVNGGGKPGNGGGNGGNTGGGTGGGTGGDTGGGDTGGGDTGGGDTGGGNTGGGDTGGGDTGGGNTGGGDTGGGDTGGGDTGGGDTGGGDTGGGDTGGGDVVITDPKILKPFAPELYFGRSHLTAAEQKAYDVILEGLLTYRDGVGGTFGRGGDARIKIDLESNGVRTMSVAQVTKILYFIMDDESRAFHITSQAPMPEATGSPLRPVFATTTEGGVKYFYVRLLASLQTFAEYKTEMNDIEVNVKKIIDVAEAKRALGYTDAQITTVLHETFLANVGFGAVGGNVGGDIRGAFKYTSIDGSGRHVVVCQGYAKSYLYLLQRMGIKSIYITGSVVYDIPPFQELHAWNKIQLNGKWYNADPTFDDDNFNIPSTASSKDHYLKSDATFGVIHARPNYDVAKKQNLSYAINGVTLPASDTNDFPASEYTR